MKLELIALPALASAISVAPIDDHVLEKRAIPEALQSFQQVLPALKKGYENSTSKGTSLTWFNQFDGAINNITKYVTKYQNCGAYPGQQSPTYNSPPIYQAPPTYDAPTYEAPTYQAPVQQAPTYDAPQSYGAYKRQVQSYYDLPRIFSAQPNEIEKIFPNIVDKLKVEIVYCNTVAWSASFKPWAIKTRKDALNASAIITKKRRGENNKEIDKDFRTSTDVARSRWFTRRRKYEDQKDDWFKKFDQNYNTIVGYAYKYGPLYQDPFYIFKPTYKTLPPVFPLQNQTPMQKMLKRIVSDMEINVLMGRHEEWLAEFAQWKAGLVKDFKMTFIRQNRD